MSPQEQNILDTVNTLVMLFRAQKHTRPDLSEELQHSLKITQEHLDGAHLTIPVFINTLQKLYDKGYLLYAFSPFEEKYRTTIKEFYDDDNYLMIREALEKSDSGEMLEKLKTGLADMTLASLPANIYLPREELVSEEITIGSVLDTSRELLKEGSIETISFVILSPFRSIERLLEKLNEGTIFADIKDEGIWYDPVRYELHFDDITISTAYQNKPIKAHFALKALFNQFDEPRIDYTDIPEFDLNHVQAEKRAYRDSLTSLLKKHLRLSELFTVHKDHLEIHEGYLGHSH